MLRGKGQLGRGCCFGMKFNKNESIYGVFWVSFS